MNTYKYTKYVTTLADAWIIKKQCTQIVLRYRTQQREPLA